MAVGRRVAPGPAAAARRSPDRSPQERLRDVPLDGPYPARRDDADQREPRSGVAMRIHVLAALAVALVPASALAQTANVAGNAGPLVLQRIDNGLLIAPDYKITSFDGKTGQLLGATGGWSQENTLFIGGA